MPDAYVALPTAPVERDGTPHGHEESCVRRCGGGGRLGGRAARVGGVGRARRFQPRPGVFSQGISRCPAGYYAFGGGGYFSAGVGDVQGAASSNSTNSPSADGTAWTYAGVAPPGVRRALVTVTQCAPRTGRDFLVQFGNPSTDGDRETSNFVDCPGGYTAIAGGFYASNPDGSLASPAGAERSGGSGGRWSVLGFTPANTKLVALAQCLRT